MEPEEVVELTTTLCEIYEDVPADLIYWTGGEVKLMGRPFYRFEVGPLGILWFDVDGTNHEEAWNNKQAALAIVNKIKEEQG